MAADDTDFRDVFNALIAERGGRAAYDTAQLAAARKLAVVLSSDMPASPAIAALLELLPARTEGAPADLDKLTDDQFRHLDYLLALARGEPAVNPTRERRRKKSSRELEAVRLAALLDKIANAKRAPSGLEIGEIKNSINAMLYGAAPLPYVLFQTSIAGFEALLTPPPSPPSAPPAPAVEAPAELPANVTKLRERIW